jgi:hypothetical protein
VEVWRYLAPFKAAATGIALGSHVYRFHSYVNQRLKTWAFSVPKNPLAGHSAPRCGIFLMHAVPALEEIHEGVRDDVLEFGIFRDASSRRLQLKLNP